MIDIELEAKFDNFVKLRENIFYFLESYNCPNTVTSEVLIVAEEVFTNIIKHSYLGECLKKIFIKISMVDNILILRFMDDGKAFCNIHIPDSLADIKKKIGGLGLYLISKLSDSYKYYRNGNWNINEITKKIK